VVVETPIKVVREYVTTHDNPEVCLVTAGDFTSYRAYVDRVVCKQ
jgi:hypothetical protein